MAIINLRDYYPFYTSDCFMEVSDEVAEMFKEFDRKEAAYRLRTYRHKAYYSLDRDDGLEHEAVFVALSPHELYERKVTMQELHAAIASLPDKQAKRIYAHFILGMTKQDNRVVKRVRYICYGKTRKQTDCDGQTGYTAHILDGIIDKLVRQIFERMKAIPKSEIVSARYREKMEQRKSLLHSVRSEYVKAAADLETLKGEVIKTIRGESSFSKELLNSLIAEAETKCRELQENLEAAQAAYDEGQAVMASLNTQYNDIISWAEMYDTASIEAKKMIVSCLIKRVEVYRDYKLHIDFNIDFTQFCEGLDIVTIAA